MIEKNKLEKTYQYLLILLSFLMPLTVFGANLIIVLIVLIWSFTGNYLAKFKLILHSKIMIASILFYLIHIIGLIWTEDIEWGFHILHKMWYFLLLLPILFTIVKQDYVRYYIFSFLSAIFLTEVISFLIWFEVILPIKNANVFDPTPFMTHVSFNPILAFAIYLVFNEILFNKNLNKYKIILLTIFALAMCVNMFLTLGRSGQVGFFFIIGLLIIQYFQYQTIKSFFAIFILIPLIFFTAYNSSSYFKLRTDNTINAIVNFETNNLTSLGFRLTYAINSWEIIKKHMLLGVGTGDFPVEYKKINASKTPNIPNTTNPHNMYVLITTQLGLLGLVSMLSIFYQQLLFAWKTKNQLIKNTGIALPLLFLVLMLGDSYLLGHYTSLLFVSCYNSKVQWRCFFESIINFFNF
jgi:O-antigen ligase